MAIEIRFTDNEGKIKQKFKVLSIKTGLVDKCFEMAEKTTEIENKRVSITEIKEYYSEIKVLLAEVFKGRFTYQELQDNVEQNEMLECYNSIMAHIGITMKRKNQ